MDLNTRERADAKGSSAAARLRSRARIPNPACMLWPAAARFKNKAGSLRLDTPILPFCCLFLSNAGLRAYRLICEFDGCRAKRTKKAWMRDGIQAFSVGKISIDVATRLFKARLSRHTLDCLEPGGTIGRGEVIEQVGTNGSTDGVDHVELILRREAA